MFVILDFTVHFKRRVMAFIAGTAAHINIDTALLYNWTALVFIGRPESVRTC